MEDMSQPTCCAGMQVIDPNLTTKLLVSSLNTPGVDIDKPTKRFGVLLRSSGLSGAGWVDHICVLYGLMMMLDVLTRGEQLQSFTEGPRSLCVPASENVNKSQALLSMLTAVAF